jgi:hypothetical protein
MVTLEMERIRRATYFYRWPSLQYQLLVCPFKGSCLWALIMAAAYEPWTRPPGIMFLLCDLSKFYKPAASLLQFSRSPWGGTDVRLELLCGFSGIITCYVLLYSYSHLTALIRYVSEACCMVN